MGRARPCRARGCTKNTAHCGCCYSPTNYEQEYCSIDCYNLDRGEDLMKFLKDKDITLDNLKDLLAIVEDLRERELLELAEGL